MMKKTCGGGSENERGEGGGLRNALNTENAQNAKLILAKEMWQREDSEISRACLFVPTAQDVSKVLGILR